MTKDTSSDTPANPQDFGLPIVDTAPIKRKAEKKAISKESLKSSETSKPEVPAEDKIAAAKAMAAKKEQAIKTEAIAKEIPIPSEEKSKPNMESSKPVAKKSNAWVFPVIIILLGLVSLIVWQILGESDGPITDSTEEVAIIDEPETTSSISPEVVDNEPEIIPETEQGSSADENSTKPEIEEPVKVENGTTIEQSSAGELIRIETNPTPSQYFIIVGSLPTEQLAMEELDKYWNKAESLYLLSPNADSKNYRLAIGRHNGFTSANEELQRVKSMYTEALWILKY